MTCHWQQDTDYSQFVGGADCKTAFHPDVGTVDACAACHKNHGTPYQWEKSPEGKLAGRTCISCHMKRVTRPIAVDGPVRRVYSHAFPARATSTTCAAPMTTRPRSTATRPSW